MYEAAFPEDSKAFTDYYYQWKIIDNEVLVMEEEAPLESVFFHVMIHLNPYALWMGGIVKKVPYLVAVATHARVRRQGKMGRVMRRLLQDLEQKEVPFAFLLPAETRIPHNFLALRKSNTPPCSTAVSACSRL